MVKSILCGLLLSAFAPQIAAADAGNDKGVSEIIVRIYNYAGVAEDFLPRARQEAGTIFFAVGIRLSWLSCTPTHEGIVEDPICHQDAPNVVSLMICSEAMLPKSGLPRGIFGFALMPQPGERARYARLYFHRLTELADGRKVRRGVLLGAMMAHEIGHLLLGVNSHSREGIMSIPWDAHKLQQINLGDLGFTIEQAATLKAEAMSRAGGLGNWRRDWTGEKKGEQRIVVYMENGMAPISAVRQAQSMAGSMFAGISIPIDWRSGVREGSALPQERTLAVRIADKALENCSPSAMAASQPYEGVHIIVFYDRVASRFSHIRSPLQSQVLTARLLAHVLVHEITHMLQGVSRHSDDGIMKAVWTPKDYRQMERRMLPFAPEDVQRIHTGLSWPTSGAPVTANTNPEKAAR